MKLEPGWRKAWVTWLYWLRLKSNPPIRARIAQDYISRFGFDPKLHPPYLTMALGAGNVTPMQMLGAYSVFANGGYKIAPYFIDRVEDDKGKVMLANQPVVAGESAEQVIDSRNAFIMSSLMRDVVRMGPARLARPTNLSMHGSAASSRRWLLSHGGALTSRRRSGATRPAAAPRCRSGLITWRPR